MELKNIKNSVGIAGKEKIIKDYLRDYGENILRLAYSYVKDQTKAEDILQETMLTVYLQLNTLREGAALKSWIYRIAINKCKDYLKSWQYRQFKLSQILHLNIASPEKSVELKLVIKDENEILATELFRLKSKYREVIILHYYEQLTLEEIGTILGIKPGTVKSRLHYGRQLLRNALEGSVGKHYGR